MLEPSSADCWISVANERASSSPSRSPRCSSASVMVRPARISRLAMWMLARQRRIGIAELAADAIERRLHAQAGIGADHQQIHEIRKAGAMLVARLDAPVDIEARRRDSRRCRRAITISQKPTRCRAQHRHDEEHRDRERRPRARCAPMKKNADRARIEDAGLDQPAAQHLGVARCCRANSAWWCSRGRAAPAFRLECRSERVAARPSRRIFGDAGGAPLDRAARVHRPP